MEWWGWAIAGLILLGAEMMVPADFFLFFLGLAALIVSGLSAMGVFAAPWAEWLTFALLAITFLGVIRQRIMRRLATEKNKTDLDEVVGGKAIASSELGIQERGKVDMRGTSWSALNVGSEHISAGDHCIVEAVDGLELHVKKN